MTISLEHVQPDDWAAVNRVTDTLRSLVIDTGGQSLGIRVGTNTAVFAAATNSSARTVTHGLGRAPVFVCAFGIKETGVLGIFYDCISTPSATSFDIVGYRPAGAITGTFTFAWAAIG